MLAMAFQHSTEYVFGSRDHASDRFHDGFPHLHHLRKENGYCAALVPLSRYAELMDTCVKHPLPFHVRIALPNDVPIEQVELLQCPQDDFRRFGLTRRGIPEATIESGILTLTYSQQAIEILFRDARFDNARITR